MTVGGPGGEIEPHLPLGAGAEFDAIRAMLREWGPWASGIGDDAAVLEVPRGERLVVSTDASVEDVHFRRDWLSAEEIGARAATAALSDLAAMAARPLGLLLSLGVPERWQGELPGLARGVGTSAEHAGCAIVGGNVTRARELSLTITVLGAVDRPLRRSGAGAGDLVYVTGRLGGPGAALRALQAGRVPAPHYMARFARPRARLAEARWLAEAGATAGIDISDGLAADAAHLAQASGLSLQLDVERVPCEAGVVPTDALVSGEEYELVVTFRPAEPPDAAQFAARFGVPLTAVGVMSTPTAVSESFHGPGTTSTRGFDHLA